MSGPKIFQAPNTVFLLLSWSSTPLLHPGEPPLSFFTSHIDRWSQLDWMGVRRKPGTESGAWARAFWTQLKKRLPAWPKNEILPKAPDPTSSSPHACILEGIPIFLNQRSQPLEIQLPAVPPESWPRADTLKQLLIRNLYLHLASLLLWQTSPPKLLASNQKTPHIKEAVPSNGLVGPFGLHFFHPTPT